MEIENIAELLIKICSLCQCTNVYSTTQTATKRLGCHPWEFQRMNIDTK